MEITLESAEQVDEKVLEAAEAAAEWFEGESRVDWDSFWDRLDDYGYFMPDTVSPAAKKIEKHIRKIRAQG